MKELKSFIDFNRLCQGEALTLIHNGSVYLFDFISLDKNNDTFLAKERPFLDIFPKDGIIHDFSMFDSNYQWFLGKNIKQSYKIVVKHLEERIDFIKKAILI